MKVVFIISILKFIKLFIFDSHKKLDGVCIIVPEQNKGWIIDAIAKEIKNNQKEKHIFIHYGVKNIPNYETILFMHYGLIVPAIMNNLKLLRHKNKSVFFTHYFYDKQNTYSLRLILNLVKKIICMNSHSVKILKALGVKANLNYIIGAADPKVFISHERDKEGKILISSAYYDRKSPEKILSLIQFCADREFILLGRNWSKYGKFDLLQSLENLEIIEAPYSEYPKIYKSCNTYISVSEVEGGPIPLVETMMCNIVPIVTNTGFAKDLIVDGLNGYIIEDYMDIVDIKYKIEQAYKNTFNVSQNMHQYSWEVYSNKVMQYIEENDL